MNDYAIGYFPKLPKEMLSQLKQSLERAGYEVVNKADVQLVLSVTVPRDKQVFREKKSAIVNLAIKANQRNIWHVAGTFQRDFGIWQSHSNYYRKYVHSYPSIFQTRPNKRDSRWSKRLSFLIYTKLVHFYCRFRFPNRIVETPESGAWNSYTIHQGKVYPTPEPDSSPFKLSFEVQSRIFPEGPQKQLGKNQKSYKKKGE